MLLQAYDPVATESVRKIRQIIADIGRATG